MNDKIKISSGAKWENIIGYSRAVKTGNRIFIGGTTAVDENSKIVAKGDVYNQTKYIFQKIEKYLVQTGAAPEDVVVNRIFTTDISKWEEIGRAHAEFFGKIKPCCTIVEVKRLVSPDMLVEVETEAII